MDGIDVTGLVFAVLTICLSVMGLHGVYIVDESEHRKIIMVLYSYLFISNILMGNWFLVVLWGINLILNAILLVSSIKKTGKNKEVC